MRPRHTPFSPAFNEFVVGQVLNKGCAIPPPLPDGADSIFGDASVEAAFRGWLAWAQERAGADPISLMAREIIEQVSVADRAWRVFMALLDVAAEGLPTHLEMFGRPPRHRRQWCRYYLSRRYAMRGWPDDDPISGADPSAGGAG